MNTIVFENNLKKVLPIQGREYSRFLSVGKNLGREEDPCVVHLQFFPLHLWQEKNERKIYIHPIHCQFKKKKKKKEKKRKKGRKKNKNKKKREELFYPMRGSYLSFYSSSKKNLFPSLVAFSLSLFVSWRCTSWANCYVEFRKFAARCG